MPETGTNHYISSDNAVNGIRSVRMDDNEENDDDEEFGRFEFDGDTKNNSSNTKPLNNQMLNSRNSKAMSINDAINHEQVASTVRNDDRASNNLGGKETKAVSCLRLVVLAVLVASATCTAIAVYFYTRNSELRDFESKFYSDVEHIIHGVGHSLYVTLGAIDSYVLHVLSQAHDTNQQFPFVTTPHTHVGMAKLGSIARTFMIQQAHFVSPQQRIEWENYTANNNQWINDSIEQQNSDINDATLSIDLIQNISAQMNERNIHSYNGPSSSDNPYLPTWQCFPIIPGKPFHDDSRHFQNKGRLN